MHYVAKDYVEFLILLALTPTWWDYGCTPPCLVYGVLGIKLGAFCIGAKPSLCQWNYSPSSLGTFMSWIFPHWEMEASAVMVHKEQYRLRSHSCP